MSLFRPSTRARNSSSDFYFISKKKGTMSWKLKKRKQDWDGIKYIIFYIIFCFNTQLSPLTCYKLFIQTKIMKYKIFYTWSFCHEHKKRIFHLLIIRLCILINEFIFWFIFLSYMRFNYSSYKNVNFLKFMSKL